MTQRERTLCLLDEAERADPAGHAAHVVAAIAWCVAQGLFNAVEGVTWGVLLAVAVVRLRSTWRCYVPLVRDPAFLMFAAFLLLRVASILWAPAGTHLPGFPRPVLTVLALWPMAGRPWALLSGLWAGCVVQVVLALCMSWNGAGWSTYAAMRTPNGFGQLQWNAHCALVLSVAILRQLPWRTAPATLLAAALSLLCTWLTASRVFLASAYLGAAAAAFRPWPRIRRGLAVAIAVAMVALGAFVASRSPAFGRWAGGLQRAVDSRSAGAQAASVGGNRWMLARAAWDIGTERPWLGIGEGAFGPALERWVARESALHPGDRSWAVAAGQVVRANDAHNALLQAWLDCGIPGLLLLVGAVGTVALRLWRRAPRDAASGAAFAVFVAVLVGVPTSVMFAKAPLALVAVCLVLAVAPPARTRAG